jgi:hypothetical protein
MLLISTNNVSAAVMGYCLDNPLNPASANDVGISTNEVTLTDASVAITGDIVLQGVSINSTNCAGIFDGNDKPYPTTNIGSADDGLLNGEDFSYFDGGAFITDEQHQNIDDIDQYSDGDLTDDPGWIMLGKDEGNGMEYETPADITILDYLNITLDCSGDTVIGGSDTTECKTGTWNLNFTDPEGLLEAAESTVFGDSFFDHLALSFKFGNVFAVYDFDFNILNAINPLFDLTTPHNLGGEFDLSAHQNSISHVTVWARDPINEDTTEISEPNLYWLFLLGLASVSFRLKRTH